jgi:hypothetical protein
MQEIERRRKPKPTTAWMQEIERRRKPKPTTAWMQEIERRRKPKPSAETIKYLEKEKNWDKIPNIIMRFTQPIRVVSHLSTGSFDEKSL